MIGSDWGADGYEAVRSLPEIHATEEAAQRHFENHLLTCLACRPGLSIANYCARGRWLDETRRLAWRIASAPRRLG